MDVRSPTPLLFARPSVIFQNSASGFSRKKVRPVVETSFHYGAGILFKADSTEMLIGVKVFPNSKKEEVIKKSDSNFEVKVRAKPVKGLANKAVVGALSFYFKIPASKIRLIKGFRERNKILQIINSEI